MKGFFKKGVWYLPTAALLPPAFCGNTAGRYELYLLAESIGRFGLMCPITVGKKEKGYFVVDGNKRVQAAALTGLEKVPCVLWQGEEPAVYRAALHTTVTRRDWDSVSGTVEGMLAHRSAEETACALGVSTAYLMRLKTLGELPADKRQRLLSLCEPLTWAERCSALTPAEQETLLDALEALLTGTRETPKADPPAGPVPRPAYCPPITDRRFYENTLNQLVRRMCDSGLAATLRRRTTKTGREWVICLPKEDSPQLSLLTDG